MVTFTNNYGYFSGSLHPRLPGHRIIPKNSRDHAQFAVADYKPRYQRSSGGTEQSGHMGKWIKFPQTQHERAINRQDRVSTT